MGYEFQDIELRVAPVRFENWAQFERETPEYSIGLEVMDDVPGHRGHRVHFDHHAGVVREATMSAAMQAYIAVRQGRLMERWLPRKKPVPVYTWNADQDVCLAAFVLEHHRLIERSEGSPLLRWIVQYNNKIDVCGGLYPVNLNELVHNHFTWVFEPYRKQRMLGKTATDARLVIDTIREVCSRLLALLNGEAGIAPITAQPTILHHSPYNFIIAEEHGDPLSRLVLASQGHTNLISHICTRPNGRHTYSVIRGSPFDDDLFEIPKLIEAFQAAEDRPKVWGGSNLAAGSDSEAGSSLTWEQLRDIAEPIVREAALRAFGAHRLPQAAPARLTALIVMAPEDRAPLSRSLAECGVEPFVVDSCAAAAKMFGLQLTLGSIFTALHLPDGDYRTVMSLASAHIHRIPIVACVPAGQPLPHEPGIQTLRAPYTAQSVQLALDQALGTFAR